jgi:hypothetical protein
MAQLVGAYYMSHAGWCYRPVELWEGVSSGRKHRPDVPVDDFATNQQKVARIAAARRALNAQVAQSKPDVIVVFGDDQLECFTFNNFPALSVYVGEQFEGRANEEAPAGEQRHGVTPGHPDVAVAILTGLMRKGFDPGFSMGLPNPERGMCHAVMRPAETLGDFTIPIVPVLVNHYFAPQPSAMRSYQIGKAVREIIEEYPGNLRVAVCGSGGLWHTPGAPGAWLNEAFDGLMLDCVRVGDARAMAEHFDSYEIPADDTSQHFYLGERGRNVTGMPGFGGPQGGTRETCGWIAACAATEGSPATVIGYVPVYASPLGVGYAYSNEIR